MAMLKGLVVVLGVLIVVALGVIAVTVTNRMSGPNKAAETSAGAAPAGAGHVRVTLPPDARVVESHVEGGRLVLRLVRSDGGQEIRLYDLATGRAAGTVALDTMPAGTR